MNQKKSQSFMHIISVLSISLIVGSSVFLSPLADKLKNLYKSETSEFVIENIMMIPSLGIILSILFSPLLLKKFTPKNLIITGLIFASIFGMLPFFNQNLILLLTSRFLFGLGVGLFYPFSISLISMSFKSPLKDKLLSVQMGVSAFGNALFLFLVSLIVLIAWHFVFLLYIVLFLVAILIFFFIPNEDYKDDNYENEIDKISKFQYETIFLALITFIILNGIYLKLPSLLSDLNANESISGVTMALMNIFGFFAGLTFYIVNKKIGKNTLLIGYLGTAIATFLIFLSISLVVSIVSAIFINFIFSWTGPRMILELNSSDKNNQVKVNSLLSIAVISSGFIATIFWNFLGNIFKISTNQGFALLIFVIIIIVLLYLFIRNPKFKKEKGI